MYGDRDVMRYIGSGDVYSRTVDESEERLLRLIDHQERHGFSLWAVTDRETGSLLGDAGLILYAHEGPEVELGFRLGKPHWGRGFATEAAAAWLEHGFRELGLDRIVAVAHHENVASQRVLEKVGMRFSGITQYQGGSARLYVAETPY